MLNDSGLRPMEFNVVIKMDPTEEKTAGGIIMLKSQQERDELATDEGTLIACSPLAFTYASESEWGDTVPPGVGDRVLFAQYQGRLWKPKGDNGPVYRIVKDKDIVAVIERAQEAEQPAPEALAA